MPRFSVHHAAFVTTTTNKTVWKGIPATGVPFELVFLSLTGSGSVAPNATDLQHEFGASMLSAAGAGTFTVSPYTPEQFRQGSRAAQGGYHTNASAEPTTYAANPFLFGGFNQRNGYVWGVQDGSGALADLAGPTAFDNMGVRVRSSLAHVVDFNAHIIEP